MLLFMASREGQRVTHSPTSSLARGEEIRSLVNNAASSALED
jgi:hypothetical protein